MTQPMQPMGMVQPIVEVAPVLGLRGMLKMHLHKAILEFHAGPPLERMSPFVEIRIGNFEWKSVHKEHAGRNPDWGILAKFDFEVLNPDAMMHIDVKDHMGLANNESVGHAEVPVHSFCRPGGGAEWLELKCMGMPAGRIHFTSEFMPN